MERSAQTYLIEGAIARYVVVSVPVSTTWAMAEKIDLELTEKLKKPVLVVTSNIKFLEVKPLPKTEVQDILKRLRGGADGETPAAGPATAGTPAGDPGANVPPGAIIEPAG